MKTPEIVAQGNGNGDGMVIRYRTARGTDIFGLAVSNMYFNAEWDLGPTWCYVVLGRKTSLIDTGRPGNLEHLRTLLKLAGREISDIDRVIITHGHEDHDGNLAEVLSEAGAHLCAYPIYRQMISYHPDIKDGATHPELPGSCRLCYMPESFYRGCLPYHKKRSALTIGFEIEDARSLPDDDLYFVFTPGHSPDSVCIILDDEAIFTGDTLLPDITPHPSLSYAYEVNRQILPQEHRRENVLYGLTTYLRSLNKIARHSHQPLQATFPAHRLFYGGQFNIIHSSSGRAREIIQFHIERCRDILNIIGSRPAGLEDIALQYFPASSVAGIGKFLALNEIRAHIEIMEECGDVCWDGGNNDMARHTGSHNFLAAIGAYLQ